MLPLVVVLLRGLYIQEQSGERKEKTGSLSFSLSDTKIRLSFVHQKNIFVFYVRILFFAQKTKDCAFYLLAFDAYTFQKCII